MDIATFRADFPQFANVATFPDSQVTFYLGLGETLFRASVWKTTLPYALELFIAHNLTLMAMDMKAVAVGGLPGGSSGAAQSKSVGQASISYDSQSVMDPNASQWNATSFGRTLWRLIQIFGAGARQV